MKKEKNNFTKVDKGFTFIVGSVLIKLSLLITTFILTKDLILVFTSYGTWGVFGQKLIISFTFNIALIATIMGKVGINTSWMHKPYIFQVKRNLQA